MLVAGSISELIGRKKTLILGQIFMIIGWVVIYFAQNFLTLLVGRFIIGIGIGIGLPVTTLQLRSGSCPSEWQQKVNRRPKVNCRIKFGLPLGQQLADQTKFFPVIHFQLLFTCVHDPTLK